MILIRKSCFCVALVFFAGQTICQQPPSYSNSGQTTIEDIERDNLKSSQSQSASPPAQPQYVQYQTPDQYNQYYKFAAQQQQQAQPIQYVPQGQPSYAAATPLYTVPNQQAAYSIGGQQTPYSPNQQPLIYYTQTKHPTIDFAGVSLYPVGNPFGQTAAAGFQSAGNAATAPLATPSAKTAVPAQLQNAYVVPNTYQQQYQQQQYQQQYYQPVALNQAANAQYLYNTLYQLQSPQKSYYSAGIKSTTPAVPLKGKDDYVPIGGGSNYYTQNADPYAKTRA